MDGYGGYDDAIKEAIEESTNNKVYFMKVNEYDEEEYPLYEEFWGDDHKNLFFLLILNFSNVTSSLLTPTSPPACSFPTSIGTFDLFPLSTIRILSREDSSRGWLYLVNTCANVDSRGTCGDMPFAPAVQVTSGECHSLGRLEQRTFSPFVSDSVTQDSSQFGITVSFQGGHSCGSISRNFSITVICADVERVRNANVIEVKQ